MRSPLVDTNTLVCIESAFQKTNREPEEWIRSAIEDFTNLYIFADNCRFTFPYPTRDFSRSDLLASVPPIVVKLIGLDSAVFSPQSIYTGEKRTLSRANIDPCFVGFEAWVYNNTRNLHRWLRAHRSDKIWRIYHRQIPEGSLFDLDMLLSMKDVTGLSRDLQITVDDACYAFDTALRYPVYCEAAGPDEYYLHHRQRDAYAPAHTFLPYRSPPPVPISFGKVFKNYANVFSLDEYVELLCQTRSLVREQRLHLIRPGAVEQERLREISAHLRLPPRLRPLAKYSAIGAAFLGALTVVPDLALPAAITSVAVSISDTLWDRPLPRLLGTIRCLRWALKWDLEEHKH